MPKKPPSREAALLAEGVQAYLAEHVVDGDALEERQMFGCNMWLLRGHMFLGVQLKSGKLLVRVGEEHVEDVLAQHPEGVARCVASNGRTFSGTLLVQPDQFRGGAKIRSWFEYAARHNGEMVAKEPHEKPRRKRPRSGAPSGAGASSSVAASGSAAAAAAGAEAEAEAEVLEAEESEEDGLPEAPPAALGGGLVAGLLGNRGQTFAWRVLQVVQAIPPGRVAAYGQVAALAGNPGRSRLVGKLLGDGLCTGTDAPWWRVLGSSGKISLPRCGRERQRQKLEAEGVIFRESGAVAAGTFWERAEPLFGALPD